MQKVVIKYKIYRNHLKTYLSFTKLLENVLYDYFKKTISFILMKD